jgi:hypothetical protein
LAYSKEKLSELRKKSVRSSRKFVFVKEEHESEFMDMETSTTGDDDEGESVGPGYSQKDIERLKREKQRRREELAKKEAEKDFIPLRSDSKSMDVETPALGKGLESSSERSSSDDESEGETVYSRKGKHVLYAFGYSGDSGGPKAEDDDGEYVDPTLAMDEDAWEEGQLRTSGASVDAQTKRIIHEQKQMEREKKVFDSCMQILLYDRSILYDLLCFDDSFSPHFPSVLQMNPFELMGM